MNTQSVELFNIAANDTRDLDTPDYTLENSSAPKDLAIAEDAAFAPESQESPRRVTEIKQTSPHRGGERLPVFSSVGHNHKKVGISPRRHKDKPEISPRRNRDKVTTTPHDAMEDPAAPNGTNEARRQRPSHRSQAMDESRNKRRSHRDDDMDDSRQHGGSNRSIDDSGNKEQRRRRPEGERRRTKGASRHMEKGSQRSMDGSSGGGGGAARERDRSPKRSSARTRLKVGGGGRSNNADDGSVYSHQSHDTTSNKSRVRRQGTRTRRIAEEPEEDDGEHDGPSSRLKKAGTRTRRSADHHGEEGEDGRIKRTGTRHRKQGSNRKIMVDGSDRDRRMSDTSKQRLENGHRRERKEGRRHSEEGRADRRMSEGSRRKKLDDSSGRRRKRRDPDARKQRRERALKNKDTYIPPPPSKGGDGEDMDDMPPLTSAGPSDVAPPGRRRSSRDRGRAPMDMPPVDDEDSVEEEQVFETTWQRSAPAGRRTRRSLVGDAMGISPQGGGRRSMLIQNQGPSPAANTRRPGRDRRGANVRQSQLVNMVLLQDEEREISADEPERGQELPGLLEEGSEGDYDEDDEGNENLSGSHHSEGHKEGGKKSAKALKAAAAASASAAVASSKAAVSGTKAAAKASVAVAKASGKAMGAVLGFGKKKKKPLAYAEGDLAAAGLAQMDDSNDNILNEWDAEEDELHGSGTTSLTS